MRKRTVQARRRRLFGRTVLSLDAAQVRRWLRNYTTGHPNPTGEGASEAWRWLAELEADRTQPNGDPEAR